MIIQTNSVVSVRYHLSAKETAGAAESTIETTKPGDPFVFIFGNGGLIEGFENNLRGKKVGDQFDFYVPAEQGYGRIDLENIVNVPVNVFHDEKGKMDYEMVKVGKTLPMTDNEGNRMHGTVQEVTGEHVRMDFNHPLAGQELHFVGEVLEIRSATADELAHGHVHGPGGHHH